MKRSSLKPAWAEWANRNLRGARVEYRGKAWFVVTHLKGGVWRIRSGSLITSVRLTRNGKLAANQDGASKYIVSTRTIFKRSAPAPSGGQ